MKAWEIQNSFGLDALTLAERPEPQPGPYQVLIKLRAASLNYRDLLMVKGDYNPKLPLPLIPFSDGVGEVVALGEGVTRVKVGDRVAGIFMQRWIGGELNEQKFRSALGGDLDGMLVEYKVLHEDGVVHVPEHFSDEEAATLPCAAVTAWHGLITDGHLKAGDSVLVQGTGGVSLFALQFAKAVGARVIIISSSDEKLVHASELGVDEGINYKTNPDWDKRVKELTDGVGVDHVVEVGGAGTFGKSVRAVRIGGQISLIGALSGGGEINPLPILMRTVRVQGIYVGSRDMFETMNRAIALHRLRPVVDRVFAFEEAREALRYMESGSHFGKLCIRFGT
ncbi:MAG: NAD(P)-dependent alcohol dehydrogenase [Abitibacteriaceae bacterium]|nr:NAD(P)-dependent alcohol dehydrogenase [Abditibacteriaceae bacterium]